MHKLKAILLQFNKSFLPLNVIVSLYFLHLLLKFPSSIIIVSQAVFVKAGIYALIIVYQWYMQSKNWYYYRNAGFSIRQLFIYSCIIDMLLFLALYSIIYSLHKI